MPVPRLSPASRNAERIRNSQETPVLFSALRVRANMSWFRRSPWGNSIRVKPKLSREHEGWNMKMPAEISTNSFLAVKYLDLPLAKYVSKFETAKMIARWLKYRRFQIVSQFQFQQVLTVFFAVPSAFSVGLVCFCAPFQNNKNWKSSNQKKNARKQKKVPPAITLHTLEDAGISWYICANKLVHNWRLHEVSVDIEGSTTRGFKLQIIHVKIWHIMSHEFVHEHPNSSKLSWNESYWLHWMHTLPEWLLGGICLSQVYLLVSNVFMAPNWEGTGGTGSCEYLPGTTIFGLQQTTIPRTKTADGWHSCPKLIEYRHCQHTHPGLAWPKSCDTICSCQIGHQFPLQNRATLRPLWANGASRVVCHGFLRVNGLTSPAHYFLQQRGGRALGWGATTDRVWYLDLPLTCTEAPVLGPTKTLFYK